MAGRVLDTRRGSGMVRVAGTRPAMTMILDAVDLKSAPMLFPQGCFASNFGFGITCRWPQEPSPITAENVELSYFDTFMAKL